MLELSYRRGMDFPLLILRVNYSPDVLSSRQNIFIYGKYAMS